MKLSRILKYLIGAALIAVSCNVAEPFRENGAVPDGKVLVNFSIADPGSGVSTKAFGDGSSISDLYVAVFGEAGWKQEYVKADLDGTNYSVELSILDEPCHLHFLGFEEGDHSELEFGSEEEVMATMATADGEVAYWQMIALPRGITYNSGSKTLNSESAALLHSIPLVRNFSRYMIYSTSENFVIDGARVVNVPTSGYVSAYNKSTGEFISGYEEMSVADLRAADYIGSTPANSTILTPSTEGFALIPATEIEGVATVKDYSYEQEQSFKSPVCVIVHGHYAGTFQGDPQAGDYFYRIDLTDDSDEHYPIFRNFTYGVIISDIQKAGYSSAVEAFQFGTSSDISADVRYDDLKSIENGISHISVQYTEIVVTGQPGTTPDPVTLMYQFIPDVTDVSTVANAPEAEGLLSFVTITPGEEPASGAAFLDASATTWLTEMSAEPVDGWNTITIQPSEIQTETIAQDIIIKGTTTSSGGKKTTIQRTVKIIVLPAKPIVLAPIEPVAKTVGSEVDVYISLPGGLPSSMFPMNIYIEAEQQTLSPMPGEQLSVQSGRSSFNSLKPGIKFVRTIDIDEYSSESETDADSDNPGYVKLVRPCRFKTAIAESASSIRATAEKLQPGNTHFLNIKSFDGGFAAAALVGVNNTTSLTFDIDVIAPVTITLMNGTTIDGLTSFVYTPTEIGPQTISGIKATTKYAPITMTLSASGYAQTSITAGRMATIASGAISLSDTGSDFGATGWDASNTATATITATAPSISGSVDITGTVTRTVISTLDAPAGTITRTSSGSKYTYKYTITNYDSNCSYYYSTDSSTGENNRSEINLYPLTIGNQSKNNYTIYIWAKDASGQWSNYSIFRHNSKSNTTVNATQGTAKYTYSYSFNGPTTATDVEFDDVPNDSEILTLEYEDEYTGEITFGNIF